MPESNEAEERRSEGEEFAAMSVADLVKKGLGYLLLSMGVSRPAPKPKPATKPAPKPDRSS